MPKLDPLKIGVAVLIIVILLAVGWWAFEPWRIKARNEKAAEKMGTVAAAVKPKVEAATSAAQEKTNERIVRVETRVERRVVQVAGSADPDGSFRAGLCESGLYKDDPECGAGGVAGGTDSRPR